jgi:UbiD family decarboxylase
MLWQDLREYLDGLGKLGDLKRVSGATWEADIGAITELMTERQGPALLFDDIPGFPRGYRVASNLYTTARRTAIMLGLDPEPQQTIAERFRKVMADFRPVPPEIVQDGPILQNVLTGDAIDLYKFPTPKWHENDGGRYIGTGVCVIQKDPDSDFVNVGAYRVSVQDAQTCSLFIEPDNHGDVIRRKHWARGEKCPVIVGIGQEPVLMSLAGPTVYRSPDGLSEFAVAGFLHGEPYPVVRGQFTGLPMPAHGEIAIEGYIPSPEQALRDEGPFGEWTGYYAHKRQPECIIEVKAIYFRNDPIMHGMPPVRPVGCTYNPNFGGDDLGPRLELEQAGISGVKRIFTLAYPFMRAVAIEQQYAGHVEDIIRVLEPGGDQHSGNHVWVLVDDDIDVSSPDAVNWAIATRCMPEHDIQVIPGTAVWQLDPRIPPEARREPGVTGRWRYSAHNLIINACRPWAWRDDFPPVNVNSEALRQRTLDKWKAVFAE